MATDSEAPADIYDVLGPEPQAPGAAPAPPSADFEVAINAAGQPYDKATGRLLPRDTAPSAPSEQPPQASQDRHSARLLKRAHDAGVGEDVIATVDSETLADIVHGFMQQKADNARILSQHLKATSQSLESQPRPQPARQEATTGQDAPPAEESFDWGEIEDEDATGAKVKKPLKDAVHPAFRKLFDQVEDLTKRVKKAESLNSMLLQNEQIRQNLTNKQLAMIELQKYPELFGSGDTDELDPEGPEVAKLHVLKLHMNAIPADKRTTLGKDIAKAVKLLFNHEAPNTPKAAPHAAPSPPPAPVSDRRWSEGAARPTQRAGATEPPSKDKAEAAVRDYQREHAQTNGHARDDDFLAELPE